MGRNQESVFLFPKSAYADTWRIHAENLADIQGAFQKSRLRLLALLFHGKLCVCDLMEVLEMPQSTFPVILPVSAMPG